MKSKSILLVGLGRYGRHVARKLHAMHHEIMAVDRNEELVNQVLPYTNSALIVDSTDPHFLESLGVRDFDVCIVAIGDDFQSSLETTLRLHDLGAKYVVARASSSIHEKFLLRNGADEVVYPEKQLALWTAIRCGSDHLLDYFELSPNYAIYEIAMPKKWAGHTVGELDIRRVYHVNVLGIRSEGILHVEVTPSTELQAEESVLILGARETLAKLTAI